MKLINITIGIIIFVFLLYIIKKITYEPVPEPVELWGEYPNETEGGILHPLNPSKWIIPDNEVVQYYARHTYLDKNGILKYDNNKVFTGRPGSDIGYPEEDFWFNPDYYLTHNNIGDCEDFAVALASILIAKGIHTIVIAGIWQDEPDAELRGHIGVEYIYNQKVYFADLDGYRLRDIVKELKIFTPTWMFSDIMTWRKYEVDWYEDEHILKR